MGLCFCQVSASQYQDYLAPVILCRFHLSRNISKYRSSSELNLNRSTSILSGTICISLILPSSISSQLNVIHTTLLSAKSRYASSVQFSSKYNSEVLATTIQGITTLSSLNRASLLLPNSSYPSSSLSRHLTSLGFLISPTRNSQATEKSTGITTSTVSRVGQATGSQTISGLLKSVSARSQLCSSSLRIDVASLPTAPSTILSFLTTAARPQYLHHQQNLLHLRMRLGLRRGCLDHLKVRVEQLQSSRNSISTLNSTQ